MVDEEVACRPRSHQPLIHFQRASSPCSSLASVYYAVPVSSYKYEQEDILMMSGTIPNPQPQGGQLLPGGQPQSPQLSPGGQPQGTQFPSGGQPQGQYIPTGQYIPQGQP